MGGRAWSRSTRAPTRLPGLRCGLEREYCPLAAAARLHERYGRAAMSEGVADVGRRRVRFRARFFVPTGMQVLIAGGVCFWIASPADVTPDRGEFPIVN